MKFRKKPVEIEAIQLTGSNLKEVAEWCGGIPKMDGFVIIPPLEGDMSAAPNDYIIKGVQGEFYPCKPDIFEQTYDPV